MKSFSEINDTKSAMAATVAAMQKRLDKLDAEITRVKSDGSRSPQYIAENVQRLQNEALPFFGENLKLLHETAKAVAATRPFWESKPLLLGLQRFSDSDRDDSMIRLRYATEFGRMDNGLLKLVADEAKVDGNLAVLYQAYLASIDTREKGERLDIDLADVTIPEQADALEAISACMGYPHHGELIAGQATAAGVSATRKLQLARQMQAA